jgi:hypothetical protein
VAGFVVATDDLGGAGDRWEPEHAAAVITAQATAPCTTEPLPTEPLTAL